MTAGRIASALKTPLWALQLATGAKSFKDNGLIGSRRLNALGLHRARIRIAYRLAEARRARLAGRVSAADRARFAEQGFIRVDEWLPAEDFARLRDALLSHRAPAREMVQGDAITRRIAIDPPMLAAVPGLAPLLRDPRWRGLMRYVASFDSEPLYYVQSILSHRVDAAPDPQTHLHADAFHPSLKAWYFLSDVAEDDGPLTYVPGSHRQTPARLAWEQAKALAAPDGVDPLSARGSFRIEREDLAGLGLPDPVAFAVPANTLIVADTYGFHARGRATRPSTRVELWAYLRRNPFLPWTGGDLLSLPGLAERRIGWLWALRDRFESQIGQPWRTVGETTPTGE
jgi:hypothetical protein